MADESCSSGDKIILQDEGVSSARASMYNVLRSLIRNNIEHFRLERGVWNDRYLTASTQLETHLNEIEPLVETIRRFAPQYDLDEHTPGNGYRSFISVVDSCVLQLIRLCRHICLKRSSFIFRTTHYCYELEAYTATMGALKIGLRHLLTLSTWSTSNNLFPDEKHSLVQLLLQAENIDQRCFYGRCLGFQFSESMKKPLVGLSILMTSFSEIYFNTGNVLTRTASSIFNCGRYVLNPEERAERIVDISQRASVDFCKSFWLLQEAEVLQQLPSLVCPSILISKLIRIDPVPLRIPAYEEDHLVNIPVPTSHIGVAPLCCRLLSSVYRMGQVDTADMKKPSQQPMLSPSPYLIIHCHGGGFVAQSSKSHEVYLRDWARQLNVPIFSIDYSLSPQAPYPRALEECVYAYAWALMNVYKLGSTADRIILVGDSAGGNLMLGLAMKTIELGIRKPDAIFCIYTPMLVEFIPSPSRLLCLMDPLLPFGFMLRCLKAYVGRQSDHHRSQSEAFIRPQDLPLKEEPDELIQKSQSLSATNGPFMLNEKYSTSESVKTIGKGDSTVLPFATESNVTTNFANDEKSVIELTQEASKILKRFDEDDNLSRTDSMTTISLTPDEDLLVKPEELGINTGNDYITKFLEKYAKEKEGDVTLLNEEACESDEHILFEMPTEFTSNFTSKLSMVTNKVVSGISSWFPKSSVIPNDPISSSSISLQQRQPLSPKPVRRLSEEFQNFYMEKDPYLSPYLASDDILEKMPPISLLSLHLDPCLDDSIMFAKRMRNLGKEIHMHILDKLPHGFLNFSLVSKDAHDGSKVCVEEIKNLLRLGDISPSPSEVPSYLE